MIKQPVAGNVVEDYYLGNTHVQICDDAYRGKSQEYYQRVLDDAARAATNIIIHNQKRRSEKNDCNRKRKSDENPSRT